MKKKRFSILVAALLCLALLAGTAAAAEDGKDVVVLFTSDVHCAVDGGMGYAGLAAVKNAYETLGCDVVLVDTGDAIQGGAIGTLSEGTYIVDILNELGYDAAAPGNHEFDYGMEEFLALTEQADFPYVSANFVDAEGETVLAPYTILEAGGKKLAFVGVTTPDSLTSSTPTSFQDENGTYIYGFCRDETGEALYGAVQSAVDAAVAEGAQYVIALAHLGNGVEFSPWSSEDLVANTSGIDAVLDGHAHIEIEEQYVDNAAGESVPICSPGMKLEDVGCLRIAADGELVVSLINDAGANGFIADIESQYEDLLAEVVAVSDFDLTTIDPEKTSEDGAAVRVVRTQETNLGDLCADAFRAMTGADVALMNGGGIRADVAAGDVTYGDILNVFPFGNELCMVEASGQEILDALEMGVHKLPDESGGFCQVSGLCYTVDLGVESSVQINENGMFTGVDGAYRVCDVTVGGEPLELDRTYTVASHNFLLLEGGDGCPVFQDNVLLLDCIMLDDQALIDYVRDSLGGVVGEDYADPAGSGRITILPAD